MTHEAAHSHAHPQPGNFGRAFALGIALNFGFVVIEALYGWRAGSLALLADAGHNLSDVGGLVLAWAGLAAEQLHGNDRHTYGWRRGSILASFANALILLVAMGTLGWQAVQRLQAPVQVAGGTVMAVAGVGVVINAATAWLFLSGGKEDLNIRGAFLHMAADTLVSLAVVLAGALYLWQGWTWIDPAMSLLVVVVIVVGTWSLLRQSLHLLFDGVPESVDLTAIRQHLLGLPQVVAVHDLHVWAITASSTALTGHLVVRSDAHPGDALLHHASVMLQEEFGMRHVTLQLESEGYAGDCGDSRCNDTRSDDAQRFHGGPDAPGAPATPPDRPDSGESSRLTALDGAERLS